MSCVTHHISPKPFIFVLFITSVLNSCTPQSDLFPVWSYDLFSSFNLLPSLDPILLILWLFSLLLSPCLYCFGLSMVNVPLQQMGYFLWVIHFSLTFSSGVHSSYPLLHVKPGSSCIIFKSHGVTSALLLVNWPLSSAQIQRLNLQTSFKSTTWLVEPNEQSPGTMQQRHLLLVLPSLLKCTSSFRLVKFFIHLPSFWTFNV